MARYGYQGTIRSGMGSVIQGATVQVYLAGTSTLATIYPDATSAAITGSVVTADSAGRFLFYVSAADYPNNQLFKVYASMSGYQSQTFDNVAILPIANGVQVLASDPASPTQGQTWFNSADNQFKGYNGTSIVILG
jgi:hypothetical protein